MTERSKLTAKEDFSDVIGRIECLKKIEPQKDWVLFCRTNLAMRMRLEHKKEIPNNDVSILFGIFDFLKLSKEAKIYTKLAYGVSFVLLLLITGGGLTVWAATKSMPGSPLYKVKIAVEEIRVKIASQAGKDKLQSEMATRRLDELKTVLDSSATAQDKSNSVTEVVGQLQQQLDNDKNQLPAADNSQGKSLSAVKAVADRANQVKKAIAEAKDSLPEDMKASLGDKLAEVTDAADKTSIQALEVMINKPDRTDSDNNEILAGFNEIINEDASAIKNITENKTIAQATSTADKFPINAVLVNQSDQAKELIDRANQSLKNNDFPAALYALKALNEIVNGAERIVDGSDSVNNTEPIQAEKAGNSATSTDSTATSTNPNTDGQK